MQTRFFADPEATLGTLARLFAAKGAAREVAVLTYSSPEVKETHFDNWNGGTSYYTLYLHVPVNLYPQLEADLGELEHTILEKTSVLLSSFENDELSSVKIIPAVLEDPLWRDKASAWPSGSKISNQGRVRSDNVAPLTTDGLLFRSWPEIFFYRALKSEGVSFAPLPVFIRGGQTYSRIEPDFVIVHHGITMVVEIDGDTVHLETPAEAQSRVRTLQHEGVYVERVLASECNDPQKAIDAVKRILVSIAKVKASK